LFLTLLVVPVAYVQFDRLEHAALNQRAREWVSRLAAGTVARIRRQAPATK
jgi:hypothetical protein